MSMLSVRKSTLALGAAWLTCAASSASAASTRLVRCGSASCLLVSGHRDDATSMVSINGRAIAVEGKRKWQARLPVQTVRYWSAPRARTIEVMLYNPRTQDLSYERPDLPIGLMGHIDLALLVVSVD